MLIQDLGFIKKILHDGEEVIFVTRACWQTVAYTFVLPILLLMGGFFFMFALIAQGTWGFGVFITIIIVASILLIRAYVLWYYDVVILTDQRLIDIDQTKFFNRSIAETLLTNIQEVTVHQKGMWQSVYKYGTIVVRTSGNGRVFDLENVQDPNSIQQKILNAQQMAIMKSKEGETSTANLLKTLRLLKSRFSKDELIELLDLGE